MYVSELTVCALYYNWPSTSTTSIGLFYKPSKSQLLYVLTKETTRNDRRTELCSGKTANTNPKHGSTLENQRIENKSTEPNKGGEVKKRKKWRHAHISLKHFKEKEIKIVHRSTYQNKGRCENVSRVLAD